MLNHSKQSSLASLSPQYRLRPQIKPPVTLNKIKLPKIPIVSKVALHKELLDKHVSKLIDVIQSQTHEIAALKKQLKPFRGKSLQTKFAKSQSQPDLLLPFRSLQNTDLKRYFLQPSYQFDFGTVDESIIQATNSQRHSLSIQQIDENNKSILSDSQSALSRCGIECDLIRLQRIEQERLRIEKRNERLFDESAVEMESSCNVATESGFSMNRVSRNQQLQTSHYHQIITANMSRVTEDFPNVLKPAQRQNSFNSSDTEKLSFTQDEVEADQQKLIKIDETNVYDTDSEFTSPSLQQIRRTHLPLIKQTRHISLLNAIINNYQVK